MPVSISFAKARREWKLYFLVIPSLLMIGIFSYFPAFSAVYHSVFEWQGGDFKEFVFVDNFIKAFHDPVLWQSFITVFILILANFLKMVPSIFLAVLVHRIVSNRWQYWYRVLLVVPMIIPSLVTLFIWKFFFEPNGVLNQFLDISGLKSLLITIDSTFLHWGAFQADVPIPWLSDQNLIVPSLILWGFPWIGAVGVLVFLAGLQSIGTEIYEAADIDGIGPFSKFLYIELPLILTQVRLMIILMVIGTLQGFGLQFLLLGEDGGPARAGMVPGLWMYNRAFLATEFGYACAIGMILFVFILALTWVNNKFIRVDK